MKCDVRYADRFLKQDPEKAYGEAALAALRELKAGTGAGSDFIGWLEPGRDIDLDKIRAAAEKIRSMADIFVVIGIGGSYMGAKCALDFLCGPYYNETTDGPKVYFAGNNMSPDALGRLLALCEKGSVAVNVVSKSGTTTEPAIAFRMFRDLLIRRYGAGAAERIFVTTDAHRGALRPLAEKEGYESFVVPDDIGGRYSVLTDVGLLPIAVAGVDVEELLAGAREGMADYLTEDPKKNDALAYALRRHALYEEGKEIEVLTGYEPSLFSLSLWWQQLYGESHGKEGKGIFPVALTYTQDLHSMGQYLQQGRRNNFETVLWVEKPEKDLALCAGDPADGLGYLEGKTLQYINSKAYEGVLQAHVDGGVPNLLLTLPDRSARTLGRLFSFFEVGCALGGYLLKVNPFDQPGVEDYKRNMFALLGKPKN